MGVPCRGLAVQSGKGRAETVVRQRARRGKAASMYETLIVSRLEGVTRKGELHWRGAVWPVLSGEMGMGMGQRRGTLSAATPVSGSQSVQSVDPTLSSQWLLCSFGEGDCRFCSASSREATRHLSSAP